jgi:hypothetical protein
VTVHLVKLAVGIEDAEHLARVQKERLKKSARGAKKKALRHITRHRPKRADEIADGGSIYWVIGGAIAARQRVLGFEKAAKADGTPAHAILLDPRLVRTEAKSFRAFQGWRYLPANKTPRDLGDVKISTENLPAGLRKELKGLGLI